MKCILLLLVLVLSVLEGYCEPAIEDFLENIPKQIKSAWGTLLNVIRGPVRPKRLGRIGRLKRLREKLYNATSAPPTYTFTELKRRWSENKTTPSDWESRLTENKNTIPIFTSEQFESNMIDSSMKQINAKYGFPFSKSKQTIRAYYTDEHLTTLSLKNKIQVPVIFEPTYKSVNDWNNLQRPRFAEIHEVSAQGITAFAQILKYMYGGTVTLRTMTEPDVRQSSNQRTKTREVILLI